MNDFQIYNCSFPKFILALIWKGLTEGIWLILKGLRSIWEPACKRCIEKEVGCIARNEPCFRQKTQRTNRLVTLGILIVVPLFVYFIVILSDANQAERQIEKNKNRAIQQLLDSQKPK